MAYCRNCGTELQDSSIYCPTCGTKTDSNGTTEILSGFQGKTEQVLSGGAQVLQQRTKQFWIGTAAVLLNFIFHFCKTLTVDFWITEKSYSILQFTKKAKEYSYGENAAVYGAIRGILIVCLIVIILSLAAMVAPAFFGKPMTKGQMLPAFFGVLVSFVVQFIMLILILKASNAYTGGALTFGGWMYMIESVATLILLIKLRKTKKEGSAQAEAIQIE